MKVFDKKVIIVYALLSLYILLNSFFISDITKYYSLYINPIFWMILTIVTLILFGKYEIRYKNIRDKIQIILIIMLTYILLYFLSGLLFDFTKNIYSTKIVSILKNIWAFVSIIIFKEYIREKLIQNSGKRIIYPILITALFIISDIEIFSINYYMASSE